MWLNHIMANRIYLLTVYKSFNFQESFRHGGSSLPLESLQYIGRAAITVTECDYRSKSVDIHICCST